MRRFVFVARFAPLLGLAACAQPRPASPRMAAVAHDPPSQPAVATAPKPIHAPLRSASELIAETGVARFLATSELKVAAIDNAAMERWFVRKPSRVFVYSEYPVEIDAKGVTRRPRCVGMAQHETVVTNALAVVLWQDRRFRTVLDLGQSDVKAVEQTQERGAWQTSGVRALPMKVSAWDDAQIRYSEGAAIHEVACVPGLRSVPCGEELSGRQGYCVDHDLVVRPWQPPTVLATGRVVDPFADPIPDVPAGDCAVQCEPSACAEALRREHLPWAPLYTEDAPVLAVFKSESVCRAFAALRRRAGLDRVDGRSSRP